MPNTASAKKALRNSEKKREFNLQKKQAIKIAVRNFKKAVSSGEQNVSELLSKVYSTIDKAQKTKLLKKNTASRKKSRITNWLNKEKVAKV